MIEPRLDRRSLLSDKPTEKGVVCAAQSRVRAKQHRDCIRADSIFDAKNKAYMTAYRQEQKKKRGCFSMGRSELADDCNSNDEAIYRCCRKPSFSMHKGKKRHLFLRRHP